MFLVLLISLIIELLSRERLNSSTGNMNGLQLKGAFIYSENVFVNIACVPDILMSFLYMLTVISLQMMIELAN